MSNKSFQWWWRGAHFVFEDWILNSPILCLHGSLNVSVVGVFFFFLLWYFTLNGINLGQQQLLLDLPCWLTDFIAGGTKKSIQIFLSILLYPHPPNSVRRRTILVWLMKLSRSRSPTNWAQRPSCSVTFQEQGFSLRLSLFANVWPAAVFWQAPDAKRRICCLSKNGNKSSLPRDKVAAFPLCLWYTIQWFGECKNPSSASQAKWILLWLDPFQSCGSSCPRRGCLQVMESMCLWPRVLLSSPDHPLQAWPSLSCCLT